MVKHQPLQYYEPQLCLSCLTGIYGCRWKRYQRSHDDTTKVSRGQQLLPPLPSPAGFQLLLGKDERFGFFPYLLAWMFDGRC